MDTDVDIGKQLDILIPKHVMNVIHTKIFKELLMAILIFAYYIFVDIMYLKVSNTIFTQCLNICAGTFVMLAIILFEVGYRRGEDKVFVRGIEIMFLALITLFMPYVYLKRGKTFISIYSLSCVYISVYYAIKALGVYLNEVRKYRRGLSDIKEILTVKNESYLDERNERKFDNIDDEERVSKKHRPKVIRIPIDKIKEIRKKEHKTTEKLVDEKNDNSEFVSETINEIDNKSEMKRTKKQEKEKVKAVKKEDEAKTKTKAGKKETKAKIPKKRGRKPTGKKLVKSMATARTKKKEDE